MRLIGFALLAFVLAGTAFSLSNSDGFRFSARTLGEMAFGPRLVFETAAAATGASSRSVAVRRTGPAEPLILSGLPAYQGATFLMPVDARPVSGYLQIDATMQALEGVEGVLRVSIDNARRAELQLRPGEGARSIRVQLNAREIASEQLVVSFSLQGQSADPNCYSDDGIEAIVEIEPTSAVHLTLDEPMSSHRDHALTAGRNIQIGWEEGDRTAALMAGRAARIAGLGVGYAEQGMTPAAANEVAEELNLAAPQPEFAWSNLLTADSHLFGLRQFHGEQSWRIRYDMARSRKSTLPDRLDLALELGDIAGDGTWQVLATLNGSLVGQFSSAGGALREAIDLPASLHRRQNTIEIIVRREDWVYGVCGLGPKLFAELKAETRLRPGATDYVDALLRLFGTLRQGWTLADAGAALGAADAEVATGLLSLLPAPGGEAAPGAEIRVLTRGAPLADLAESDAWLLFHTAEGALAARPLAEYGHASTRGVALLITRGAGS